MVMLTLKQAFIGMLTMGLVRSVYFKKRPGKRGCLTKLWSTMANFKQKRLKFLAGGNVYPNVIYDGFLVFNTEAMLKNYFKGAMIKLIIPLIGTEFTASDTPIHSFDFEFDFKMNQLPGEISSIETWNRIEHIME